jgi:cyclopropane-fatty-acyl-phospholipid synthase
VNDDRVEHGGVADLIESLVGDALTIRIEAYDGTAVGPADAATTIVVNSPDALVRILHSPNELGLARAYAAGDLEVLGDIRGLFALRHVIQNLSVGPQQLRTAARLVGRRGLRPLPVPPEEARPRGRVHSLRRDRTVISHHYDLSNRFYALFLDQSMTYSCAVFEHPGWTLEQAQRAKHELALRKLALEPGMRVLDIGCGWGAHALHAARNFGVDVVGVTLAVEQVEYGRKRVAEAGLSSQVELRLQDYRQVDDGPFDAISSIGMFEHVGWDRTSEFFAQVRRLVRPGGRVLLHSITKPDARKPRRRRAQFIYRYIFPDGELQPVGRIVDHMQRADLDVIEVDALNQHYATTLDHWLDRLVERWDEAVAEVGLNRARIWKLYLAGAAAAFHARQVQVHQIAAAAPLADGRTSAPRRPDWDPAHLG